MKLRTDYQANTTRNLYLCKRLLDVLELFKRHGIATIPFKGPIIAQQVYGDLSLRQFDDLDVLIREEDVIAAREILLSHNFQSQYKHRHNGDPELVWDEGEYTFYNPEQCYSLDVHWQAVTRTFLSDFRVEEIWSRLQTVDFRGYQINTLAPEDTLIIHSIHGMRHMWNRLIWLIDISQVTHMKIDWDQVVEIASSFGVDHVMNVGLILVDRWLNSKLPNKALEICLRDGRAKHIVSRFGMRSIEDGEIRPNLKELRIIASSRSKPQDQIGYLLNKLFRPGMRDHLFIRLPQSISFLYPLLRPLRLGREFLKSRIEVDKNHFQETHNRNRTG